MNGVKRMSEIYFIKVENKDLFKIGKTTLNVKTRLRVAIVGMNIKSVKNQK